MRCGCAGWGAIMRLKDHRWLWTAALAWLLLWGKPAAAETFRVGTYNVENYLDEATQTRHVKSPEARAKVQESILALQPDVLALQEIGTVSAFQELRESL